MHVGSDPSQRALANTGFRRHRVDLAYCIGEKEGKIQWWTTNENSQSHDRYWSSDWHGAVIRDPAL